jgi:Amt family ammonium transporter
MPAASIVWVWARVQRLVTKTAWALAGATAILAATASGALAQEDVLDTGDTAWMLTSTALVLMMTIPGLAMFYAGMVR